MSVQHLDLAGLCGGEGGRLKGIVRRLLGNRTDADDVAQDTFLKLRGRALTDGDRGLVFRTGRTVGLDRLRSDKTRRGYEQSAALLNADAAPAADAGFSARQELSALLAALEALPKRTQRIFLLAKLDGMSQPAIAKALGVSLSTVEKDLVTALEMCRAWRRKRDGE